MIVDSTALPEQVIKDAVQSAFTSAGQRCSALRVMYVQQDIAERVIELLKGAMAELKVGPTEVRVSDVGPVIDAEAKAGLEQHIAALKAAGKLIAETKVPGNLNGHFVAPVAFEISGIDELKKENFGPVLHVVRYAAQDLEKVVQAINATGFGLTMGSIAATRKPPVASKSWRGSATFTSTATRSARWWACNRSAATGCPAPVPRPAGRTTCCVSSASAPRR